jgi:hypothetical protein
VSVDIGSIIDPGAAVTALKSMWATHPPETWDHKPMVPLHATTYDQESDGINPYWDIVRQLPLSNTDLGSGHATQVEGYWSGPGQDRLFISRHELVKTYAWAIPTPTDIQWIVSVLKGRGVAEIGAGTGYWAWQFTQAGVDVIAVDEFVGDDNTFCGPTRYHLVHNGGPRTAQQHPDRALMLCWPPYGGLMAAQSLEQYAGDLLIYIGEPEGGCTADDDFFRLLDSDWNRIGAAPQHVTFSGIHCYVEAYGRKGVRADV